MDEGAFENLSGTGRPIPMEDLPHTDPALWMAHHIMKNNRLVPPWIAEGNGIEAERERLRQATNANPEAREALRRDIAALNRLIFKFNLAAPAAVHKPPLPAP